MQYSKLTVAGCAALMFGLIACSGEDGRDGVNGVNGLNGADGASCEVKSLKDESGYKILCGGDSVGVLLNGKTGATGKQGITGATGAKGDTGKTGPQGEKGEKGVGCSVAALADNSGYDVYCGSDKVGTIKNGTNGTNGADGASCSLSTPADDGSVTVTCPNSSPVTIKQGKDGTNCSGTTVTKDGRKGVEIACGGSVVDTLWNGVDGSNGSDGTSGSSNCTSKDDGKGTVTVTCGDATPITVSKAMCGAKPYDPADKFCVLENLFDKCGTDKVTYQVNTQYCNDKGEVASMCWELDTKWTKGLDDNSEPYTALKSVEATTFRAPTKDEFCWNGFITPKCGGKEFGVNEYCGKAYDGKTDSLYEYCKDLKGLQEYYDVIGIVLVPSEVEEDEDEVVGNNNRRRQNVLDGLGNADLIGNTPRRPRSGDLFDFYDGLYGIQTGVKTCGLEATSKCGSKVYSKKTQFCDIRDERLYTYKEIKGTADESEKLYWMTENLAFEYKLPKVVVEKNAKGEVVKQSLDIVAGKLNYETKAFENFEATQGRYYTWNSAMGVGDFRSSVDVGKLAAKDQIIGACPDGWRLPTETEFMNLRTQAAATAFAELETTEGKAVDFNVKFLGYYDANSSEENKVFGTDAANFWSATPFNDDPAIEEEADFKQALGLVITGTDMSSIKPSNKVYAFTIRCVTESDPASDVQLQP